jgi:hypothetical protein
MNQSSCSKVDPNPPQVACPQNFEKHPTLQLCIPVEPNFTRYNGGKGNYSQCHEPTGGKCKETPQGVTYLSSLGWNTLQCGGGKCTGKCVCNADITVKKGQYFCNQTEPTLCDSDDPNKCTSNKWAFSKRHGETKVSYYSGQQYKQCLNNFRNLQE